MSSIVLRLHHFYDGKEHFYLSCQLSLTLKIISVSNFVQVFAEISRKFHFSFSCQNPE